MINQNNTEHNGPRLGGVKLKPLVYKVTGGAPGTLLPTFGYLSSSTTYGNYTEEGGSFPPLGTNTPPTDGTNIYEPVRIPFIHKFGGPHCSVSGEIEGGSFNNNGLVWSKEEFLRIKLPKGTNTLSPYTCATITGVIFPYGQTNTGSVSPLGNRTATSLFRHKFTFVRNKPSASFSTNLYTYHSGNPQLAGQYAPLYSSSIVNTYGREMRTKEFQLDTDPNIEGSGFGSQPCLKDGAIDVISFTPEVSEGNCENFNLPGNFPQQTGDPTLGGIKPFIEQGAILNPLNIATANNIYFDLQGKTDGDDVSFVCIAKRGSIIKGIIELY